MYTGVALCVVAGYSARNVQEHREVVEELLLCRGRRSTRRWNGGQSMHRASSREVDITACRQSAC
ncbi:MAG: hypothetical protein M3170_02290 [Candidatus Dormibacteraeota bacterium]|nr:hypothetical protein [Candidatus Dormibacteraeota bacterium]